jgi:tRNA threonylcarbamoyladenosine biosynthesis protein TsaE
MGERKLAVEFGSEAELVAGAARFANALRAAGLSALVIGLSGELGSGKTTWARAMLRGLGYAGRVPSPTYTLLEQYACDRVLVAHLDLYRLRGDAELENLGLRDGLDEPTSWTLVEWPERATQLARRCDLLLTFGVTGSTGRSVVVEAATPAGNVALSAVRQEVLRNDP